MKKMTLILIAALAAACGNGGETSESPGTDAVDSASDAFWHGGDAPSVTGCTDDSQCDDGNDCTEDRCHWDHTCINAPMDARSCDDGDPCTTDDQCLDGLCLPGPALDCDDGNPCTVDSCDPAEGCAHGNSNKECDDGNGCTVDDTCVDGACIGTAPLCDDGNDCTADSCDEATGECTFIPQSNFPCDDANACTNGDQCHRGVCIPGTPVSCDDRNPCTIDSCIEKPREEGGGCLHTPDVGLPCSDGNPCSSQDACTDEGTCLGTGGNCDDDNPCTTDICNPIEGCYYEPASGESCDDGDPCTATSTCKAGICVPGPTIDCDDDVGCTLDSCDEEGLCVHTPDDLACNDGLFCNGQEWCDGDLDCQDGEAPDIDDGIPCTTDSCHEELDLIQHLPQHFLCNDSDPCTTDLCNPETGCQNNEKVCDDANPCTADSCNPADGQCLFQPLGECCLVDSDCVAGEPCTGGVCDSQNNECAFYPMLCDDHDPCTADSCADGCQHQPIPGCLDECDTALDCLFAMQPKDYCVTFACVDDADAGHTVCETSPKPCDDDRTCTVDSCDPALGCLFVPIPWCQEPCDTDADCEDGDACSSDACVDGLCANESDICDDGLACTGGECNPLTGQCQLFECPACQCPTCQADADCDDSNLCTTDVCLVPVPGEPGVCRHLPVPCNDGNPCTKDMCLNKQGCFHVDNPDCTGCHNDADCDDSIPCTTDSCVDNYCTHAWSCG